MATTLSPYSSLPDTSDNPFAKAAQAQMEAAGELARIGAEAMRQLVRQQQDIFLAVAGYWREAGQPRDASSLLELPLDNARFATEIALRNASELAEITRQAQTEMMAVLTSRTGQVAGDAANAFGKSVQETEKLTRKAADRLADATEDSLEQVALAGKLVQ